MTAPVAGEPELIDLHHLGRPHVIGAWRLGDVIIDPGPSSCLPRLLRAIDQRPPEVLALTHIHLDHAGCSGTLVQRFPEAEVWVHERGAPHLVDPTRLIDSATRLYGADMERLWGEVLPVPAERLRVLRGGEQLGGIRIVYTPGHASHHVAYLHEPTGCAFTGDVAGVRIDAGCVLAPTPPPEVDLQAWAGSIDVIEAWRPRTIAVTHFGAYGDVEHHLRDLREAIRWALVSARDLDEAAFTSEMRARVARSTPPAVAQAYEQAVPPWQSFRGLARYLDR
jgi:glyoxylase-like metal-dependent hydrolase (beta-lactamase superfamily II)